MQLPEFTNHSVINEVQARFFNADCQYNLILERNFLSQAGIYIMFPTHTVHWLDRYIDMKQKQTVLIIVLILTAASLPQSYSDVKRN